jgi:hypothetical protein
MATGLFNLKQVNQAISQGAWSGYIAPKWVEYLVVAGGGGGGKGNGGGGGAGGLLTGIVTVAVGTSYTVTVGTGGAGATSLLGTSGVNSVFGAISSTGGGGGGGGSSTAPTSGGSGGGAGTAGALPGAQGISGQGNAGGASLASGIYPGGGGGGAGTVGLAGSSTGGNGGAGIASAIAGTVTTYSGGGGGGVDSGTAGTGGVGGGGSGGSNAVGVAGGGNTGGGGGGAGYVSGTVGGAGGSGIVVVRYPGNVQFYTGGTVTYSNGYIVHNFTANGTLAPTTPTVVSEYQISRSLRFNSADSTYLSRTATANGSRTTATASLWVKRSVMGAEHRLIAFDSSGSGTIFWLFFNTSDQLQIYTSGTAVGITSTQVFRDPSAWYHIVVGLDTNQATSSDRIKVYVNGSQITAFTGTQTYYSQGASIQFNNTAYTGFIGFNNSATLSGYMTEVNWIDGQQLTPTSFGYVNPTTGIWSPAKFVGGYGTNGFYLNFSDNSNTTAATLGKDYSGNGNNWTPNNFSVTAGAGNDSLVDSPTSYGTDTGVGGTVRGNYCTLNPLFFNGVTTIVPTNGNLDFTFASAANRSAYGTIGMSSGKWYCEVIYTTLGSSPNPGLSLVTNADTSNFVGFGSAQYSYDSSGVKINNNSSSAYGASWNTSNVIGIAFDADAGTLTFYKDGVSQGVAFSGLTAGSYVFGVTSYQGTGNTNFGQRPFAYTAPSGFKALCTQNLPTPTIGATTATTADKFFAPVTFTSSATGSVTISSLGFQPDFTWWKSRATVVDHYLMDVLRGNSTYLASNRTLADQSYSNIWIPSSSGWTSNNGSYYNNDSNVAWNWKANGSGSSNTSGSITSTVSANTTSGFSVVTYTGLTVYPQTIGHGLGAVPSMIIIKNRSRAGTGWAVYHSALGNTKGLLINTTDAAITDSGFWNNTTPTSTVFTTGNGYGYYVNAATDNYVAYCFAEVAGYSKFGSYTGNGSADGPFVYTGMRPSYVMVKRTNSSGTSWNIFDATRSPYNVTDDALFANLSNAESANESTVAFDILSNGFKLRTTGSAMNGSGDTYIYMAFASNPFKYSLAR